MVLLVAILVAVIVAATADQPAEGAGCPLADTRFEAPRLGLKSLAGKGCRVVNSDTGRVAEPRPLWGSKYREGVDCQAAERHQRIRLGGDRHRTATGRVQPRERSGGFRPFRRLTVIDGDDVWGERCELGNNENRFGDGGGGRRYKGTFALYPRGERMATFISVRLPKSFRLGAERWQTIMQMKHANPSDPVFRGRHIDVPSIGLEARSVGGRPLFRVYSNEANPRFGEISFPARKNRWVRFVFDVFYSPDPRRGWIQVGADLNGDGDLGDRGEVKPKRRAATLVFERRSGHRVPGAPPPGRALPLHLRSGLYHDPEIACPGAGCAVDVDNIQVLADR